LAIEKTIETARSEMKKSRCTRNVVMVVLLDVKNAFNSLGWDAIRSALSDGNISPYLRVIISNYLSERMVFNGKVTKQMTAGVPQGSILGPTLWNLTYNDVFKLELPEYVNLVGYADDLALIVKGKNADALESKANEALEIVDLFMKGLHLELNPAKSEAIIISGKKKCRNLSVHLHGKSIEIKNTVKYLGVILDKRLLFSTHLEKASQKALQMGHKIAQILPNTFGSSEGKRRVLASVTESIMCYASQIWIDSLKFQRNRTILAKSQRTLSLRVCRAFRTAPTNAIFVLARTIPWDIKIDERDKLRVTENPDRKTFSSKCIQRWQAQWQDESQSTGKWTRTLIPNIEPWYNRKHGEVDYYLTQALTGHGVFEAYFNKMGLSLSPICYHCNSFEEDDAFHCIFRCEKFKQNRSCTEKKIGQSMTVHNLVNIMLENVTKWDVVSNFLRSIMKEKERLSRERGLSLGKT